MKELKIGKQYYIVGHLDDIDTIKVAKIIIEENNTTYITETGFSIFPDRCYETIDEVLEGIRDNIEKDYQFRLKRMSVARKIFLNKMKLNGQSNE